MFRYIWDSTVKKLYLGEVFWCKDHFGYGENKGRLRIKSQITNPVIIWLCDTEKIFLKSIDFNIVFHDFVFIPKTYILLYPLEYHYNFCSLCFLIISLCLRLYYTSILALLLIAEVRPTKFQQYVCLNLSWTRITTSVFSVSFCSWGIPLMKNICVCFYH